MHGGSFETVTSCNKQKICQTFKSNYRSIMGYGPVAHPETGQQVLVYQSILEVKDVRRDENAFKCLTDGYLELGTCEFVSYVKPLKPTCDTPVLTSFGEMLSVTCKTDQVYPNARCIFSSDTVPANFSAPVTYSNSQSPVKPDDFSTQCEGRIPVSAFSVGRYQFQVTMYADVKDGKEKTSIESDLTDPIELSLPRVAIASDCPVGPGVKDGFIKKGTTATCKCELSYEGFPAGHAQWFTRDDVAVGVMNPDGSATLRLADDASDVGRSFECRANSPVSGIKHVAYFSPTFTDAIANNEGVQTNEGDGNGDGSSIYLIVGMVVLGFVLVIVIIVAVFLYRRKKALTKDISTSATKDNADNIPQHCHQLPPYEGYSEYSESGIYELPSVDHGYAESYDMRTC